ncbi:MAG TPA: class I SAM-dependent methyltransferase [candidate division Zixibacteria bacterium]|nr:class I SAM-dependent methyltransferase [candidate division Zixibacteria bacterium]
MDHTPYQRPELYELAFGWRDFKKAVDFITEAANRTGLTEIKSMVELGCGPGQYCREFARRGVTACGVDLSPEMVLYAQKIFDDEKLPGYIIEADFRNFSLEAPVDLAVCMMATFNYLLTNEDIVRHFRTVAANLNEGGVYLIELPHPRDIYSDGKSTQDVWEMEDNGLKLRIDWGSDGKFDPLTEIDRGTVRFTLEQNGVIGSFESLDSSRRLSLGHLRALLQLADCFSIAGMYGDLDCEQPFDNTKKSWRLLLILKKLF